MPMRRPISEVVDQERRRLVATESTNDALC